MAEAMHEPHPWFMHDLKCFVLFFVSFVSLWSPLAVW